LAEIKNYTEGIEPAIQNTPGARRITEEARLCRDAGRNFGATKVQVEIRRLNLLRDLCREYWEFLADKIEIKKLISANLMKMSDKERMKLIYYFLSFLMPGHDWRSALTTASTTAEAFPVKPNLRPFCGNADRSSAL
jgi:hypothetical protein